MYVRPCVAFRGRRFFFLEAKLFREKRSCSVFLFFGMHLPSQLGGGERNLSSNPQKQCPEIENLLSSLVFFRMWEKAFESLLLFYRINSVAAASFSALFQIFALPPLPIQHKRSPALSLDRVSQTGICNLHKIFLPEKKKREIFGSPNFVGSCYQYMPHAKSLWFPRKKSYTEEERRNHHYLPSVGVAANLRKVKAYTGNEEEQ